MKLALVILAVLGLGSAMPSQKSERDLQGDFEDIFGLIPFDEIRAIARRYAQTDEEFIEVVLYLQGPEWAELVDTVANHPSWISFKDLMLEAGVDINGVIEFIHDLIAGVEVGPKVISKNTRSLRDFVDEVLALVDGQALLVALNDKLTNSADFQEFFELISSEKAHAMVEEIRQIEEVQRIAQELRDMGIDVDKVIDFIYEILGWTKKVKSSATRDLQGDFEDIFGLIPFDEIRAIARRYAQTDEEFIEVVLYLQGPAWAELVDTVGIHPTWISFKDLMLEAGVDINGVIEFIHDLIAGVEIGPKVIPKDTRSVRDFVDEVLALVDGQALLVALNDKLTNSADFQEFFELISSEKAHAMVEEIRQIEEVQRIAQELREMGIDVDKVIDFIYEILGWTKKVKSSATRDLQGDFEDIFGLIPFDEIRAIARRYAETDEEFIEVVLYLQGPAWAELVDTVGNHPTWISFKDLMLEAGVDINGVIEFIHDLIAGVEVGPKVITKSTRSVRDFVDEVLALVDGQALLVALNDKLTNSADFQEFFELISSEKAHAMVEEIRQIEEVQRIAQELREMGIDVDKVIDFIYEILGWTKKVKSSVTRDLQGDFEDIFGLIPFDEIRAIARRYAETDEEFIEVVLYLQGPAWAELVDTVGNHPTWISFKDLMLEAGVDINGVIEFIHDLIAGVEVGPKVITKSTRSVRDFVDEVLALVDGQALLVALNDKLTNSADFQEFFELISSEKAHAMVEEIRQIEEVQRIAQELREMGIDVDKVIDFIYEILGWTKKVKSSATRDLQGDFEDIFGLIPFDEIRAIARRYAETDEEFIEVVLYLQGPAWAELVDTVGNHPTWISFKDLMLEAGVDINGVIEFIHDLIAGVEVGPKVITKSTRSVRDFVDEVLALVDGQALLVALNDKLTNSADFQEFFELISSEKAHAMVEEIRQIEEVQRIAQELREMGIDVDKVIDFIYEILGWA